MLEPLQIDRLQTALSTRNGWLELGAVLACFAVGWWVDRKLRLSSRSESRMAKLGAGSVNRLIFPVVSLVLLLLARAAVRVFNAPVFLPIAIPLAVALALIRLCVYALRSAFGQGRELPLSERTVSFVIWGALLLYYLGVLTEVFNTLEGAELTIGRTTINLLALGRDAVIVVLALMISLWLSGFIEARLMRLPNVDRNVRAVLAKFSRALLLILGLLISLPMLGIDLTVLSVFGGALGVGIGLGLQKLASNYIAGFTILLDRSVRIGDMITVDSRTGIVSKATARYVVVRSLDGVEAIVPNETLVTTTVLNHSHTDRNIRIAIPVQISYESDLDRALQILEEVAMSEKRVLRGALAPAALVLRFADSGIDLELGVWINDPENGQNNLRSAINRAVWKGFAGSDIQIPYPRRDVRIVDLPTPLAPPTVGQSGSDTAKSA
ncbi:MAG: mechanosensitive ion channel domain-containing protein [Casimicrobiaceae bacterium]